MPRIELFCTAIAITAPLPDKPASRHWYVSLKEADPADSNKSRLYSFAPVIQLLRLYQRAQYLPRKKGQQSRVR